METVADSVTGDLPHPEVCSCEEALALREEVERLRVQLKAHDDALEQGRSFWSEVDEGHPAFELLKRLAASTWQTSDLALPRAVKDYVGGVMLDRENPDLLEYPCNCQYCQRDWVGEMSALTRRVQELEDLGYAGALKLATAYADMHAVEARLREAVGLLREWHHRHAASNPLSRKTASLLVATYELQPAAPDPIHPHGRVIEQAQCTDEFEPAAPAPECGKCKTLAAIGPCDEHYYRPEPRRGVTP